MESSETGTESRGSYLWAHIFGVVGFILFWAATGPEDSFERKLVMGIIGGFLFWWFAAMFKLRWRLVPLCMVAGALGTPAAGLVWFDSSGDCALLWEVIVGAIAGGMVGLGLYWVITVRGSKTKMKSAAAP